MSENATLRRAAMGSSWLVQRLEKPRGGLLLGKDNPFSFGGGYRNGGLSNNAMDLLREVWSFDYMGAAEFEFGAVPEALQRIAKSELTAFSFTVPLAAVPKNWRDKSKTKPKGDATIYVLCPARFAAEVEERINEWARNEYPKLKEGLHLTAALRPVEEWDSERCGWLELDNGFLFFTDDDMWRKACHLFGVTITEPPVPA